LSLLFVLRVVPKSYTSVNRTPVYDILFLLPDYTSGCRKRCSFRRGYCGIWITTWI